MSYSYPANSNRLSKVTDSTNKPSGFKDGTNTTDDYVYDANGNMVKDLNKGIGTSTVNGITYNHLNLPTKIIFNNDTNTRIEYLCNALGQKVQKKVFQYCDSCVGGLTNTTTDYLSGFQYTTTGTVVKLSFFPHAEGYVNNTVVNGANVYNYVFNYTDHLGNIRLSYAKDPTTNVLKIIEENHYYPFGLKHTNYNSDKNMFQKAETNAVVLKKPIVQTRLEYQYKFSGKEYQDELGLNMYDYGARNYEPAIVRTLTQDPLAEKFTNVSPYSFLNNNPLRFIDPTGMENDDIIIRGKNVETGKMEPAVVVKTDLINVTIDRPDLPLVPTHDIVTEKTNPIKPIVINGVDRAVKALESTLGKADAISVNFGGGIVAGGGISGGGSITTFLTGKDAGGVFGYSTDGPSPSVGLSIGGGVEVGAVFASSATASDFNRYTLTGPSINVSAGYGPASGTASVGIKSAFNWTPTSYSVSVGTGFSSFKTGGALSVTNTVLQGTLKQPSKR